MAKIKMTYVCPKCEEGITAEQKPEKCPSCGSKFSAPGANGFVEPQTITEQAERLSDPTTHRRFLIDLPIDKANNIVNDALNILETISGKKVPVSDIRNLVGMAIRMGEIAKKYEEFLTAGGTHTPELLIIKKEVSNDLSTTRDGEKASGPVPTPLFLPVEQTE